MSSLSLARIARQPRHKDSLPTTRCTVMAMAALVVSGILLACGGSKSPPLQNPAPNGQTGDSSGVLVMRSAQIGLRPGDAIRVEIWREPDLSGDFEIDQNGWIVLPLLGGRQVTGISPEALERELIAEYQEYLESPSVNVKVLRRLLILGEVREPGIFSVDATFTLTDALALAGGVSPRGNKNDIRLIRNGRVIQESLVGATVVGGSVIQSGDQIVVGERPWLSRNLPLVTAGIGALTSISIALFLR